MFEATRDSDHLGRAVQLLRQALVVTPDDDPDRPSYALNLSVALRAVAAEPTATASATAIAAADEAIAMAELAHHLLPATHSEQAACLSDLGRAHRLRADLLNDLASKRLAISYRRLAADNRVASPTTRALAARAWGEWSREDGDLDEAVRGYLAAVRLLALVAWHGLDPSVGEHHLRLWRELAQQAAATGLDAHRQDDAVTMLEQGRTIRWNQLLDRRTDLSAVRARYSELADRLDQIRRSLDTGPRRDLQSS